MRTNEGIRQLPRNEIIEILSKRDGYFCFICKEPFTEKDPATLDHWIPKSKGGTWDLENLRLMHKRENALKGDRMPSPDGTLPTLRREDKLANRRADRRVNRPDLCTRCEAGRKLGEDDVCDSCGSGPMPRSFPRWKKMRPSECDHDLFWCWACGIGIYERRPAIFDVLNSDELDG